METAGHPVPSVDVVGRETVSDTLFPTCLFTLRKWNTAGPL